MSGAERQLVERADPAMERGEGPGEWKHISSVRMTARRPGEILAGRYRLISRLGEGGMGSVWKARSLLLEVDVAVKVVKRSAAAPHACERLLREARAAAALAHPSIVRVFDFGTTDEGEPFLVMQLLRGKTLRTWLHERRRLPATVAVQLLLPIASAVAEVHQLGIMHRDIKPENIILEEGLDGQIVPKLVDFGIAKQSGNEDESFTQSGALMGSPAYMAPEQARGKPDLQSDVWSLSVVLYELITGKRPFEGPNHGAILYSVFGEEPEPTHTQAAGDKALWEIIQKGLAKKESDRWPDMKELGRALATWASGHDVTEDAAGVSFTHQWLGKERAPSLEQPTTPVPHRLRATEHVRSVHSSISVQVAAAHHTNSAHQVHMISSRPLEGAGGGGWLRGAPVLGIGAALAVLASVVTFLALSPAAPPAAAALPPPSAIAIASSKAFLIAAEPPPEETPAPSAAPTVSPAPPAPIASAAPTLRAEAPARAVKPPPAPPRRPPPVRTSLPLPARPDF